MQKHLNQPEEVDVLQVEVLKLSENGIRFRCVFIECIRYIRTSAY